MGLLLLFGMPIVGGAYSVWAGSGIVGILLRGVAAGICLLPPTLLMGATLPAIARWVERTPDGVAWLGFFYGGNTAGAVLGSLLAGFYLLSFYDISVATYVAVALNIAVALSALAIATRAPYHGAAPAAAPAVVRSRANRVVYLVIGLSGLTALASEVIWTRLLSLLLGATTYTFSLILRSFSPGCCASRDRSSAGASRTPRWRWHGVRSGCRWRWRGRPMS
jgi:spermidine synthase